MVGLSSTDGGPTTVDLGHRRNGRPCRTAPLDDAKAVRRPFFATRPRFRLDAASNRS